MGSFERNTGVHLLFAGAGLLAAGLLCRTADAVSAVSALGQATCELQSLSVFISVDGAPTYTFTATCPLYKVALRGARVFDPKARRFTESFVELNGNRTTSHGGCIADPWLTGQRCSGQDLTALGSGSINYQQMTNQAPLSATFMSPADRKTFNDRFSVAYESWKVASAAAAVPMPTSTRTHMHGVDTA